MPPRFASFLRSGQSSNSWITTQAKNVKNTRQSLLELTGFYDDFFSQERETPTSCQLYRKPVVLGTSFTCSKFERNCSSPPWPTWPHATLWSGSDGLESGRTMACGIQLVSWLRLNAFNHWLSNLITSVWVERIFLSLVLRSLKLLTSQFSSCFVHYLLKYSPDIPTAVVFKGDLRSLCFLMEKDAGVGGAQIDAAAL